ncbi:acyltransferase family protein [Filimonas effusa]|uniref:Acyltransferase n=1 Tax=Filimonas effusa TaxID=2508721 RepID=A0A4Q1D8L2_9BACT|nr:acyltransferase [Filimonas effusa]RXK85684.1 acyltransferase [Filimonas effusa]
MEANMLSTKPHYPVLDALRGVAAITVLAFHIFEMHATSHHDQIINHGYLAVDFFFLLSGYVIGYAYDDRWHQMSIGQFFRRRIERLQPMVIIGMLIGGALYYFHDSPAFPNIHAVPVWKMLLVMLVGCTLLPLPPSADIRGWGEMHPLNGPGWSLFFEYIANILYGLFARKLSKKILAIVVGLAAAMLIHYAVTSKNGDMVGGWTFNETQLKVGFTRMLFPFFGGLLLCRTAKLIKVKHAFWLCSLLLLAILAMPRIGSKQQLWMNGLYESLAIVLVFPLIVYLGASADAATGRFSSRITKFLGDISYPLYITHYPLIYTYAAWWSRQPKGTPAKEALPAALLCFFSALIIAYACLKLYDEPVRRWLKRKALKTVTA